MRRSLAWEEACIGRTLANVLQRTTPAAGVHEDSPVDVDLFFSPVSTEVPDLNIPALRGQLSQLWARRRCMQCEQTVELGAEQRLVQELTRQRSAP